MLVPQELSTNTDDPEYDNFASRIMNKYALLMILQETIEDCPRCIKKAQALRKKMVQNK